MDVFRHAIDALVSDIALFGICPVHKCNISEIKYKKNFEEKFNNGSNSSKSVIDSNNIMNDSSSNIKDNSINAESVNEFSGTAAVDNSALNDVSNNKAKVNATHNNSRKRTASSDPVYSSSRIRVDKDGKRNTVPLRNPNIFKNDVALDNKYANLAQLPVEREVPPAPPKIQPLMVQNNNNYRETLKKLNDKFGNVKASLANEYIKVYPETAERHSEMQKFC
ncbi:hypothetical protein AVEN_52602-1 [Araneus ventricosus]|uniref:Uncharacterized protein n=1 Tax=Araneus ventricosus TaxID=182803 RepID=A0A4Y2ERM0_ARAVE|nr:hypothetical protein AVEN_52602-1 [Araneus ventricosus]